MKLLYFLQRWWCPRINGTSKSIVKTLLTRAGCICLGTWNFGLGAMGVLQVTQTDGWTRLHHCLASPKFCLENRCLRQGWQIIVDCTWLTLVSWLSQRNMCLQALHRGFISCYALHMFPEAMPSKGFVHINVPCGFGMQEPFSSKLFPLSNAWGNRAYRGFGNLAFAMHAVIIRWQVVR